MALANRGAKVWLSDLNGSAAREAAEEIGKGAVGVTLDVVDAAAVEAHVGEVIAAHGHLDAIFNNAGIGIVAVADELDASHFDKSVDVNIKGVSNGFVAAYKHMAERGSGIIVNTASGAGLIAPPMMAPYATSKFAVVGMTRALRVEAAERGVQVSALCPMAIETPLLDSENPEDTSATWRPSIREYLTDIGGPPYPVDRFVTYALEQIERNKGIIVAPFGARMRIGLARFFPGLVEKIARKSYLKQLALRDVSSR